MHQSAAKLYLDAIEKCRDVGDYNWALVLSKRGGFSEEFQKELCQEGIKNAESNNMYVDAAYFSKKMGDVNRAIKYLEFGKDFPTALGVAYEAKIKNKLQELIKKTAEYFKHIDLKKAIKKDDFMFTRLCCVAQAAKENGLQAVVKPVYDEAMEIYSSQEGDRKAAKLAYYFGDYPTALRLSEKDMDLVAMASCSYQLGLYEKSLAAVTLAELINRNKIRR